MHWLAGKLIYYLLLFGVQGDHDLYPPLENEGPHGGGLGATVMVEHCVTV